MRRSAKLCHCVAAPCSDLPRLCRAPLGAAVPLLCRASAKRHDAKQRSAVAMRPSRCFSFALRRSSIAKRCVAEPLHCSAMRSAPCLSFAPSCLALPLPCRAPPREAMPCVSMLRFCLANRCYALPLLCGTLLFRALPLPCSSRLCRCLASPVSAVPKHPVAVPQLFSSTLCVSSAWLRFALLPLSTALLHVAIASGSWQCFSMLFHCVAQLAVLLYCVA